MRAAVGAVAVLGLAVAAAGAQPTKERAAALKAPQPLSPDEVPPLARGAESFPTTASGTPVARPAGPAWLAGDSDLTPAGGLVGKSGAVRTLTPPALGKDEKVPPPPKMLDRIKPGTGDKAPAVAPTAQPVAAQPPAPAPTPAPTPTDRSAFRGTGTNGAPVFAGPPAYRWYGWGSVTPGANPLAPAGQYPKASANWYQITGATPGAFPVPVSGTARTPAGVEPPSYGLAPRTPAPAVTVAASPVTVVAPPPAFVERPEPPRFAAPPESKFPPAPAVGATAPPAVPVPALSPPPVPKTVAAVAPTLPPLTAAPVEAPVPPSPVAPSSAPAVSGVPAPAPAIPAAPSPASAVSGVPKVATAEPVSVAPPVGPVAVPVPVVAPAPTAAVTPVPAVQPAAPVAVVPAVPVAPAAEPTKPTESPKPVVGTSPAALPPSVTAEPQRYEPGWKQSKEPAARPGTWAPANAPVPLPTVPPEPPAGWHTGRADAPAVIARGQVGDTNPDPIDALIRQICQGRATDVEVRHTGTKKIQVCFETRTADDAKKLVADISRRPELTSYQIDFCVVVK